MVLQVFFFWFSEFYTIDLPLCLSVIPRHLTSRVYIWISLYHRTILVRYWINTGQKKISKKFFAKILWVLKGILADTQHL